MNAEYQVQTQPDVFNNLHPWVDWEQAIKSEEINEYSWLVKQQLSEVNFHACPKEGPLCDEKEEKLKRG